MTFDNMISSFVFTAMMFELKGIFELKLNQYNESEISFSFSINNLDNPYVFEMCVVVGLVLLNNIILMFRQSGCPPCYS